MIRVPSFFLFLAVFLTGTVSLHAAGAVTGKQYAAGTGQTFSYFAGRLPHEVSVARSTGGSLTYGYSTDGAKDLTSATWPEVTSGVFTIPPATQGYGYDRAGRLRTIGDSSGNRTQAYQNGRLKATTWNSGLFAGNQLITDLDTSGRDCGFTLNRNGTTIHSATRVPDGVSGEISEVSSGGLTIVIKRNAARQITGFEWHPSDPTAPVVTQTWSRGSAGRILSARSSVVGSPSFDWINDQTKTLRISAASGARVWAGLAGGDLTEIPDFNLTGSFNLTLPSTQSSGWVPWHTLAMLPGEGEGTFGANAVYNPLASPDAKAEQSGAVWIPPVNETFAYDADGNRQSTALWDYGWDGRNTLVRARTKDYNTAPQGYDITCDYDAEGRRFKKFVTTYQNGSITAQDHITFLWDGWDMIYERHQQPSGLTTLERKYVWGPDLSGSHGGAGGAGGLLLIRETRGTQTADYYPLYDGGGHVIALADSNSNLVAEYAYGPFGEQIYARGPHAQSCPFRYATKYYDSEMGLYYFGRRYLDPITGQWLSREPLGEDESLHLYAYCHNDPVNKVDDRGLAEVAVNSDHSLTTFGLALVNIAKGDPQAARSLLLAAQVQAEVSGAGLDKLIGNGGGAAIGATTRGITDAVGRAFGDGRDEWLKVGNAAELGAGATWWSTELPDKDSVAADVFGMVSPALTTAAKRSAERAARHSSPEHYTAGEIALEASYIPPRFLVGVYNALSLARVTTGQEITFKGWKSGLGLNEVPTSHRYSEAALTLVPMLKLEGALAEGTILYRGLAEGENIVGGLVARAPGAGNGVIAHVAGQRASQWISSTKSLEIAQQRFGQFGIVAIDTSKVTMPIVDVSAGLPGLPNHFMLPRWARATQEVLIQDYVPEEAVWLISGPR